MMDLRQQTRFWQFHNCDAQVASLDISNVLSPVQLSPLGTDGNFHHSIQIAQIDDIYVWHSLSSTGFLSKKQLARNSMFELHFVEAGVCSTVIDKQAMESGPGDALLFKDLSYQDIVCQPDTALLCIAIPAARYSMLMASKFGDPSADLSAMRPVASSRTSSIGSLKQIVDLVLSLGRNAPVQEDTSTAAQLFCEGILTFFAESWPRSSGHPTNHSARPFYIKRALEWIQAHAAEKVTLEKLAAVSGVSGRTLQLGFQSFCGLSPMAFLQNVRLQKAYQDLVSEPASTTVDEIARRWRFSNPGKFAADIRAAYGENPLVIRRRPKKTSCDISAGPGTTRD
ncbi:MULTISPECIES: helix-turn-helix domain-containing protein [unclassified Rhizobium]|uniref:AraC family transcriptional regulator n=1 Tax=unclassified Rhizobium TaxID=2613769 RepID=UPI00288A91C1|nr:MULTISPECIES: helix-turn-helix domain-containing protein [unclassified Rhizobium]